MIYQVLLLYMVREARGERVPALLVAGCIVCVRTVYTQSNTWRYYVRTQWYHHTIEVGSVMQPEALVSLRRALRCSGRLNLSRKPYVQDILLCDATRRHSLSLSVITGERKQTLYLHDQVALSSRLLYTSLL